MKRAANFDEGVAAALHALRHPGGPTLAAGPPLPRSRRPAGLCEPCGGCPECVADARARRDVRALRAALRSALKQIEHLAWWLNSAGITEDEGDEEPNPHAQHMRAIAARARRVAARIQPLTSGRRRKEAK